MSSQEHPMKATGGLSGAGAGGNANTLGKTTSTNPSELDSQVPSSGSEVPLSGVEPAHGVSFKEQVQGHAKMFAGKAFGNDKEVQEGAARIRGLEQEQHAEQK